MQKVVIKVLKNDKLSKVLCDFGFSYASVLKMIRLKDVKLNNNRCLKDCDVFQGDEICAFCLNLPNEKFEIVFEDENIFIINKFAGIEVVGENGLEGKIKGAIAVHRIDRNTQGLLIMAKNKESEEALLNAFKDKLIVKKYICEVVGPTKFNGEIKEAFLKKDETKSKVEVKKSYFYNASKIQTIFKTLKSSNTTSVVEAQLVTGKTHQIRAHLAFLGHAILGDGKYGKNEDNKLFKEKTQKLFCFYLKLNQLLKPLEYLNGKEFLLYPNWFKV